MRSLFVDRNNLDFLLHEVLFIDEILGHAYYGDHDLEAVTAVIDLAEDLAENYFFPCAAKLDHEEPVLSEGSISTPPELKEALAAYADAGFFSASFSTSQGGLQLPVTVMAAVDGIFAAANMAVGPYSFLTIAAAKLISVCASEEQKNIFLAPMMEGKWYGTMCLSEPQAGSSLSDIRTKAEPTGEGHYLLSGSKMWITGGDQDLTENIVHLVLAKIPGGPPGVKGISLFIVPKFRADENGTYAVQNDVAVAGINHKMGARGAVNTLMSFGENGDCHAYLIGEPHKGLTYMFHMMNEARICVGNNATMSGLAGYLYSLDYARNRPQGRHPGNKDPESAQVMLSEHADVKRMLLAQRASVEGALHLVLYCATLVDKQKMSPSSEEKQQLDLLLEILTPITKSWPSEFCLEANKHAIQILGGYGYTREYPVERFYRDNRLNAIHEGAHGIHGIDLLDRKVRMNRGAALDALVAEIDKTIERAKLFDTLSVFCSELSEAVEEMVAAAHESIAEENRRAALANGALYLDAFGHVVIAWLLLEQAYIAHKGQQTSPSQSRAFYDGKVRTCTYFFKYELQKARTQLALVKSMDTTCLEATSAEFDVA